MSIMSSKRPRMVRESETLKVMIALYYHRYHKIDKLCSDCRELLDYALERLRKCPFQESKTTCVKCPVHCYNHVMRERVRAVMRYAGPRMTYRHPLLALFHFIDGLRKEPVHPHNEVGDN